MTKNAKRRQEQFEKALDAVEEVWRDELWPWEQQKWFYQNVVRRSES